MKKGVEEDSEETLNHVDEGLEYTGCGEMSYVDSALIGGSSLLIGDHALSERVLESDMLADEAVYLGGEIAESLAPEARPIGAAGGFVAYVACGGLGGATVKYLLDE